VTVNVPLDVPGLAPDEVLGYVAGYDRDVWPASLKKPWPPTSTFVVAPSTTDGVARVVSWADATGLSVSAFGAGTNVVGAIDGRADVTLSLEHLSSIEEIDPVSQTIRVGAGALGGAVEERLNAHGFTLGHYPQSLHISTVGGWLATRATGTYSARYGGIDHLVRGLTVVLADGTVETVEPRVRAPGGIDAVAVLVGAEGSLGIVTELVLSVQRISAEQRICAMFDTLAEGLEAQRELIQSGYRIGLLRLYNGAETAAILESEGTRCLMIVTALGPAELVEAEARAVEAAIERRAGTLVAPEAGDGWYARRYRAAGLMEEANSEPGAMFDTIEVSLPWSTVAACAEELESELSAVSRPYWAHFSHAYTSGVCLYLMLFVAGTDDDDAVQSWRRVWDDALRIVRHHGGCVGHHHGIGSIRSELYLDTFDGRLHRRLKDAIDPAGTLHAPLLSGRDLLTLLDAAAPSPEPGALA
jgi:alkyldihydroxyacetonephosphate synthase